MLYFPQTRIELSVERPVAQGSLITAEGVALVNSLTGGSYGVKHSAGAVGEVFAGVAFNSVTPLTQAPKIQEFIVGASPFAVVLDSEPLPGTVRVVRLDTNLPIAAAGAASATEYEVDGGNPRRFIFHSSMVGVPVSISYSYAPTLVQAMALQGNVLPGGPAGQYLGQVGVITRGDVYTDQWNTAADWSSAVGVVLLANGKFGPTSNPATAIRGVQIIELPSASRSYLGLNINASV